MPSSAPALLTEFNQRHQVFLERNKSHEVKAFEKYLLEMAGKLRVKIGDKNLTEFSRSRLEALIAEIHDSLVSIYSGFETEWRGQILDLAEYEAGFEIKSLNQVVDFDFKLPSQSQLRQSVFGNPLSVAGPNKGMLLEPFFNDVSRRTLNRVSGTIRAGAFQGLTTPQIVRQLIGTKKAGYFDGIIGLSYKDAAMMTRTALQHSAMQARQETWSQNSDIIQGWVFRATLDYRTTQQCQSLDGTEYKIGEGPMPPVHIGCRSSSTPKLNTEFDFLREGATRSSRGPDGVEAVDAKETYFGWLKKQPKDFQDAAIGPTRAKLLRDGGLSAERFAEIGIGRNFEPLTLKQMRDLDPTSFSKAGL